MGPREFAVAELSALLTFETNSQGRATQIVLRQNGVDRTGIRLEEADAKRVKDQTPAAGGDSALRRAIGEVRTGKPNYESMSPQVATTTRQQLAQLQPQLARLGSLLSLTFQSVTPNGADIYRAEFENGAAECRILVGPDGTIEIFGIRPL